MVDPKVLEKYGSTKEAIRRLFTCKPPGPEVKDPEERKKQESLLKHRERFERLLASRIDHAVAANFRNYHFYAAADLAWDSHAITKMTVPLMQYAQGKLKFTKLKERIKDLDRSQLEKFCEFDDSGEIKEIDLPKFHATWVNIVRSFVTRRTASVAATYVTSYPMFKYNPYSTSWVAKLRGDVLSQRSEMIVNQYNYRHDLVQVVRDMHLYGHTVEFPARSWDREEQIFLDGSREGLDETKDARTVREGLPFVRPHPTRVIYDNSKPLSGINTNTGPRWIGFWDVRRYGDVATNPQYFNRHDVEVSAKWHRLYSQNAAYFEQYFDARISFPSPFNEVDVAGENDRLNNMTGASGTGVGGRYSTEREDDSVVVTEYRERVIPKEVGLGDYPHPVWLRLIVAGDRTVIWGEFLPSLPSIYYGYNENDGRQLNISFAHEAMEWQDPLTNMLTQLLMTQSAGLIKLITLNTDMVKDPKIRRQFKELLKGNKLFEQPRLIEYSAAKLREAGIDPRTEEVLKLHEAKWMDDISQFFRGIIQLLSLAERVLHFSAQEQGQAAPREITAHEVMEIRDTTQTMHAFHRMGIDEGLSAKKQLLYEAWMAYGDEQIEVPVTRRYSPETIEAAGFTVLDEGLEGETDEGGAREGQTLIGSKRALLYNYNFSSRDGAERVSNTRAAEVMVQFLAQLPGLTQTFPGVLERIDDDQIVKLIGEIFRLSGASDLKFELPDPGSGNSAAAPGGQPSEQEISMTQLAGQITEYMQQNEERNQQFQTQINQIARVLHNSGVNPVSPGEMSEGVPGIPTPADPFSPSAVGSAPVDEQIARVLSDPM